MVPLPHLGLACGPWQIIMVGQMSHGCQIGTARNVTRVEIWRQCIDEELNQLWWMNAHDVRLSRERLAALAAGVRVVVAATAPTVTWCCLPV
eukprot:COSAG02_NODE_38005_length_434_cov_2.131343_1_plen_91_part_01